MYNKLAFKLSGLLKGMENFNTLEKKQCKVREFKCWDVWQPECGPAQFY